MPLQVSPVSKCLDKKLMIFGFEVYDLLAIFLVLSVLNLVFGQSVLAIPLVWAPTAALAIILRVGKRGKPDKFLIHWIRFQIQPGILSAFYSGTVQPQPRRSKKEIK